MTKMKTLALAFFASPALLALAQEAPKAQDTMIPQQSIAITWIVGFGILVVTLIAGFKSAGRTHLD